MCGGYSRVTRSAFTSVLLSVGRRTTAELALLPLELARDRAHVDAEQAGGEGFVAPGHAQGLVEQPGGHLGQRRADPDAQYTLRQGRGTGDLRRQVGDLHPASPRQ